MDSDFMRFLDLARGISYISLGFAAALLFVTRNRDEAKTAKPWIRGNQVFGRSVGCRRIFTGGARAQDFPMSPVFFLITF
jgi:hypothetical protein